MYNIFVSEYNNNSKKISHVLSKTSSLALSAYISDQERADDFKIYSPDKSRDLGEVTLIGLILPDDIPESDLELIHNTKNYTSVFVGDCYPALPKDSPVRQCILIRDPNVISRYWSLNDQHVAELAKQHHKPMVGDTQCKMRLYTTMVHALPVAQRHFPENLYVTREDLVDVNTNTLLELYYEFYLSKGYVVELATHKNELNIDHAHSLISSMTLNYKNANQPVIFDSKNFIPWLSRNYYTRSFEKIKTYEHKVEYWTAMVNSDPSDRNKAKLQGWNIKRENGKQEYQDINKIIGKKLNSGTTYNKYKSKFMQNQLSRYGKAATSKQLFSPNKNQEEIYHESFDFLDRFKVRFAQLLNTNLIRIGLLNPGKELYTAIQSSKLFITIKEGVEWNVEPEQRRKINWLIKALFKLDKHLYFFDDEKNKVAKRDRRRVIVHEFRSELKASFNKQKMEIAKSVEYAKKWISEWKAKMEQKRANLQTAINELDLSLFPKNWQASMDAVVQRMQSFKVPQKIVPEPLKNTEGKQRVIVSETLGEAVNQRLGVNDLSYDYIASLTQKTKPVGSNDVPPEIRVRKGLVEMLFEYRRLLEEVDYQNYDFDLTYPNRLRYRNDSLMLSDDKMEEIMHIVDDYSCSVTDAIDDAYQRGILTIPDYEFYDRELER
jgi:hypothetical protein